MERLGPLPEKVRIWEGGKQTNKRLIVATTVEIQKIVSINPPPKLPPRWHGNIAAGGYIQSGNVDRAGASISAELLIIDRTTRSHPSMWLSIFFPYFSRLFETF